MTDRTTKYDLAVWRKGEDSYAFPLGLKDSWGGDVLPKLDDEWQFVCVLPKGVPVKDIQPVQGNKVRASVAGQRVYTADYGILGYTPVEVR